jgi:hypothetical protein
MAVEVNEKSYVPMSGSEGLAQLVVNYVVTAPDVSFEIRPGNNTINVTDQNGNPLAINLKEYDVVGFASENGLALGIVTAYDATQEGVISTVTTGANDNGTVTLVGRPRG